MGMQEKYVGMASQGSVSVPMDRSSEKNRKQDEESLTESYKPRGRGEDTPEHILRFGTAHALERDHRGIQNNALVQSENESHRALDDYGHTGAHAHDEIVMHNAHPHQQHSVGYGRAHKMTEDTGELGPDPMKSGNRIESEYENHGYQAFHVVHPNRDKAAEHHPPKGRVGAYESTSQQPATQTIFGGIR